MAEQTIVVEEREKRVKLNSWKSTAIKDPNLVIKRWIWAYFLLLIFEGALRKWVLPGLSTPLLVIRDPIAIYIIYLVWQKGLLPKTIYLWGMVIIALISCIATMTVGHGSLPVTIFGARILLFHFPLMFAMGRIFNQDDVIKLGRFVLWLSIPMIVLIALQFYSPQSAFVNRGVGGDTAGAGFSGAMGFFRPPGTFSFTNGNSLFFGFLAPFVIWFWLNSKHINKIVLILASGALMASVPFSISRSLLGTIGVSGIFAFLATIRNGKYASKMIMAGIALGITLMILSQISVFQTAINAFSSRFESASKYEGGVSGSFFGRYIGGYLQPFKDLDQQPFFGYGIGMGTSAGSQLLTGKVSYLIAEDEWGRLVGEMGPLLGLGAILIRIGFCVMVFVLGYKKMAAGDLLPWMLISFGLLIVLKGQWAQPTSLGFSTLLGGLILGSLRNSEDVPLDVNKV